MKKSLLFAAIALLTVGLLAQDLKEVTTGASYANDVYYSLEEGTVTTVARDNWDIAFVTQIMSVSILANNATGVELYTYPDGDISDWATLDTTGMEWIPMYNSIETFDEGAFNRNTIPGDDLDYGWGRYNMTNHHITGDSLFVIKTVSGAYKKLAVVEKIATANSWEFKYANLDGTGEQIVSLDGADYSEKYFIHYSIDSTKFVSREPASDDWDMLFTKYYDYTIPYYVTGVLFNDDHVMAQEVRESGLDQATHFSYEDSSFTSDISTIGSDWKEFDMGEMAYVLADTVVYYLKTIGETDSTYYKLYFTGFSGGSFGGLGVYNFTQQRLTFVSSIRNESKLMLELYPNPASDYINVVFDHLGKSDIHIVDVTGRVVYSTTYDAGGFTNYSLDISSLKSGLYFMQVQAGNESNVLRFIKE